MPFLDPPSRPLNILVLSGDFLQGKPVLATIKQLFGTKTPACSTFDIICGAGPVGGWLALIFGLWRLSHSDASPVWGTLEDLEILPPTRSKDKKLDEKKFLRNIRTLMEVYDIEDKLAMPLPFKLLHTATDQSEVRCKHVFVTIPKPSSILYLSKAKSTEPNFDILRAYDLPGDNISSKEALTSTFVRVAKPHGSEADGIGLAIQEAQMLYGPEVPIAQILNIKDAVREPRQPQETKDGKNTHIEDASDDSITFDELPSLTGLPTKLITIHLPITPNPRGESVEGREVLGPWFKKPGIKWEFDNIRKIISNNNGSKDSDFLMDVSSKLALWQEKGGRLG